MTSAVSQTEASELTSDEAFDIEIILKPDSIKQPNFPVQWRFSPNTLDKVRQGLRQGHGYAVLVVATRDGDHHRHFEVREVNESLQFLRLIEVPRPGDWTIGVLLFERTQIGAGGQRTTDVLCKEISSHLCSTKKKWRRSEDAAKYTKDLGTLSNVVAGGVSPRKLYVH